jgi:hypothetical protein
MASTGSVLASGTAVATTEPLTVMLSKSTFWDTVGVKKRNWKVRGAERF